MVSAPLPCCTPPTSADRWMMPITAAMPASSPSTTSSSISVVNRPGVLRARAASRPLERVRASGRTPEGFFVALFTP